MSKVYFVHAPSVNLVKIGRSVEPVRRFGELQLLSPVRLEVISIIDGGSELEALLHQKFAPFRSHGEWFHAVLELLHFAQAEGLWSAWNAAGPDARQEFMARIDAPIMDARYG